MATAGPASSRRPSKLDIRPRTAAASLPASAVAGLQRIPGIGPSLARDLWDLGIRAVANLRGRNAEQLYSRLNELRGVRQDRCVLYTFRCAIYFASEPQPDPERLKWWNWKD